MLKERATYDYLDQYILLMDLQKYEEAIYLVDGCLKLDSNNAKAYNNKGLALKCLGKKDEAIINFRQAIKVNHTLVEARLNLIRSLIELR